MIVENNSFRNKTHLFKNREIAGELIAPFVNEYEINLLLAIPNGGVPVAKSLITQLEIENFNLLIIRKIPLPSTAESGFGAITPDGQVFLNNNLLNHLSFPDRIIKRQISIAKKQIEDKMKQFNLDNYDIAGKSILLVDDGIASGYSMIAGSSWLKQKGAKEIHIAVPTGPLRSLIIIEDYVDEIICLNIREGYSFAVADAYQKWYDVPTTEVREIIKDIRRL
ncbi:MAG: phosphoribosyltransferase [Candidatus Kariarchaeaceae archaeon]|jgi:predicted phosphoribosyltransferase